MSIAYGGIIAFMFRGANILVAFALVVVTSNALGPSGRGTVVLGLTAIGIVSALTGGLTAAAGRQVSNQRRPPGEVLVSGGLIATALGAIAVIAGFVVGGLLSGDASKETSAVGVAAAAVILNSVIAGVFLGHGALLRYNMALVLAPLLSLLAIVTEILVFNTRTPAASLWAYALGQGLTLPLLLAMGAGLSLGWQRPDRRLAAAMARFAGLAGMASGISYLNYRADVIVVEHFEGKSGVAIYSNAVYIAESVWQFSGSLALATYARMGSLPRAEAAQLTTRVMRHTLVILFAVCAVLFLTADIIVGLFFDKEFAAMATALRILLPGVLVYGLAQSFSGFYTYQAGKPVASAVVAGAGLIVDIALALILVPILGVNGAALASSIAYGAAIVGGVSFFLRNTHTSPSEVLHFGRADIADYRLLVSRLRQLASR